MHLNVSVLIMNIIECLFTGATISFIMKHLLIVNAYSATISVFQLNSDLDVTIRLPDPHYKQIHNGHYKQAKTRL